MMSILAALLRKRKESGSRAADEAFDRLDKVAYSGMWRRQDRTQVSGEARPAPGLFCSQVSPPPHGFHVGPAALIILPGPCGSHVPMENAMARTMCPPSDAMSASEPLMRCHASCLCSHGLQKILYIRDCQVTHPGTCLIYR
jgi:hypothetical protein